MSNFFLSVLFKMVNPQIKNCKQITQKDCNKKTSKERKKSSKNVKRRIRRKRNKFKHYQSLRKQKALQNTEDLCNAVEFVDITDMEWSSGRGATSSAGLPAEIVEWQKRDQIAYWKSKAIALELENKMLRQHLRDVYAKTVEEYTVYSQMNQEYLEDGTPVSNGEKKYAKQSKSDKIVSKKNEEPKIVTPLFPECKNRSEELKKFYGEKSPKILGMETALQLNYERHLEKSKPSYWPNLPLRY